MERSFGSYYPDDDLGERRLPDNTEYLHGHNIWRQDSPEALDLGRQFRARLEAGEALYLLGFLGTTHNSGLSLLRASRAEGVEVLANFEEERFAAVKHFAGYPRASVEEARRMLTQLGVDPTEIFGVFYAFDVVHEEQSGMRMLLMNSKLVKSKLYRFITESAAPSIDFDPSQLAQMRTNIFAHSPAVVAVVQGLVAQLGLRPQTPCVMMLHHENHAYFSYGVSPFAAPERAAKPTMIACIDGGGDLSSISLFKACDGRVELLKRNYRANSLGVFYMLCSSLLGGWAALSSEGRYMGAAAWGNGDRLTNPFYRQLRQFFHFADGGQVFANTAMTEDNYRVLEDLVGPFVPMNDIWNPDSVLNVDDVRHSPITRRRVDIAAAVQMVFEDAVFHVIADLIAETGSDQLVMCGGTGLNCVANMRLLDHFADDYYRTYVGRDSRLQIWVPPIPSDQGVVVGAAYQFAVLHGARPQGRLPTPFLCGLPPARREIENAIAESGFVTCEPMGNINIPADREALADWMAYVVGQDGVIGVYQGAAETGPRALGHRSILSNPCNPDMLAVLNQRVKLREKIRPLAPMVSLEEAPLWFELAPGAATADYDAYDFMVLTAKARVAARSVIPAVVHHDGTSRLQIVRERNNPLIHAYLKALKRHIGVEVSVNTSLNVGSPIVQTPAQALDVFRRSNGLDAIFMVADDGAAYMVWAKGGVQKKDSDAPVLRARYLASRPRAGGMISQAADVVGAGERA
ncbi:MAG TPA: carbamoyltransferase C-terminal domain-containing protein [Caulobacteraceae bacterium]|jgi:carbamoyltransferase